jgi:hypothetical protein
MRSESAKRRLHPRIIDTDWLILREMHVSCRPTFVRKTRHWITLAGSVLGLAIGNALSAVVGTTLIFVGAQNALRGFLLAIINGNEAPLLNDKLIRWTELRNRFADGRKEDYRAAAS